MRVSGIRGLAASLCLLLLLSSCRQLAAYDPAERQDHGALDARVDTTSHDGLHDGFRDGPRDGGGDVRSNDGKPDDARELDGPRLDGSADGPPPVPTGPICQAGWCWENPLPQGNDLAAVWMNSPTDIYAVGPGGTALYFDGLAWRKISPGAPGSDLKAVWGAGAKDVWIAGSNGKLVHFDGANWTQASVVGSPDFVDLWGSASNDVYAATLAGVQHFDGSSWTSAGSGAGQAVWGSGKNDVYVAGALLAHWTGTATWAVTSSPVSGGATGICGTGPNDIFIVSSLRDIAYKGAGAFKALPKQGTDPLVEDLYCDQNQGFLAATTDGLRRYTVTGGWIAQAIAPELSLRGVAGQNTDWAAVGDGGALIRHAGGTTIKYRQGDTKTIRGLAPGYAVGDGGLLRRLASGAWIDDPAFALSFASARPRALTVTPEIRVVGDSGFVALRTTGGWQQESIGVSTNLRAISGAQTHVYVVGDMGTIVHHDTTSWKPEASAFGQSDIHAVWALSNDEVYAAGVGGLQRRDPTTGLWAKTAVTVAAQLDALWMESSGVGFAANASGAIYESKSGDNWALVTNKPPTGPLYAIAGRSSADVWAAGASGLFHWDGSTWTLTATGKLPILRALHVAATGEAWVGGDNGAILRKAP